ncbi:hypothetical protein HA402_004915 [Bradysia odoriphaga]|nr:hypothetical protein HA402_004915 [Bradysia odoriphaga]
MPLSNLLLTFVYAVVCIVGLMGNTLVIYVVLRFSNMQTVTNMYILNLAIADECYLIGIPFLIATVHMGDWVFGQAVCKIYMVSTSITQYTSSIFLLIMSADRYIAICHHISSPKYRTPMVSRIVSILAWVTSVLIMLPIMMYADIAEKKTGAYTCNVLWPDSNGHSSGFSFTIYALVLGFAVPIVFISFFYFSVIKKLRSMAKKTNKSKGKRRSHKKVTKLVLTVITVYIMCWMPYWISQVSLMISTSMCSSKLEVTIFLIVGCLGYINSAINPILYAYLSDNFKKSFLKACTCATTKDVNAQLKMENSVLPRKTKDCRSSESQFTLTTRCTNMFNEITTATTVTAVSNVSSRNPSPPLPGELEPVKNENLLQLS